MKLFTTENLLDRSAIGRLAGGSMPEIDDGSVLTRPARSGGAGSSALVDLFGNVSELVEPPARALAGRAVPSDLALTCGGSFNQPQLVQAAAGCGLIPWDFQGVTIGLRFWFPLPDGRDGADYKRP